MVALDHAPPRASRLRKTVSVNLAYLLAGEVATRCVTFVVYAKLARDFGPAAFGWVEITLAVTMFATLVGESGYRPLGVREVACDPRQTPALLRAILSVQVGLSLVVAALMGLVAYALPIDRRLAWLLAGYAISLPGLPWLMPWVFQGLNRMGLFAATQLTRQVVFGAVVLAAIRGADDYWMLPAAEILGVFVAALLACGAYRAIRRPDWTSAARGRLFAESLPIGASQLIWAVRMFFPVVLVGLLSGQTAAGLFGAAQRIMLVFQSLLAQYSNSVFPSLAQAAETQPAHFARLINRSLRIAAWPTLALALGATWLARPLVRIVFGTQFSSTESPLVLAILIWIIPVLAWRNHARDALYALGRPREEMWASLAGLLTLLALALPLTSRYGPCGAAASMLVAETLAAGVNWARLRRYAPQVEPFSPLGAGLR